MESTLIRPSCDEPKQPREGLSADREEAAILRRMLEEQSVALREAIHRADESFAVLAHELRNPLAAIASAAALLADEDAGERATAAAIITRQTGHLTRLIEEILDVSRFKKGKVCLRKELLDLAAVLDGAVESSRPVIDQHGHEFVADYPRQSLFLEADAGRLRQMIVNLLANAAQNTPPGGHVSLCASREGNEIVLRVKDDGVGISPVHLVGVFKIFTQGERALARTHGGLGLGLAIVRAVTELHGGAVSAASDGLGRGSEFTVRLPAAEAPVLALAPLSHPAIPSAMDLSETRILVVDDHRDCALALARLLQRRGYQTDVAQDGFSAINTASAFHPDVVLLDGDLPGLNGREVARRLRQDPAHRHCLLITISGYEEKLEPSDEAGSDHYLPKPVDVEKLLHFITDYLGKSAREIPAGKVQFNDGVRVSAC